MKLTPNFSKLWKCVSEMGADRIDVDITIDHTDESLELITKLTSKEGMVINPEDLEINAGLLSFDGYQVVVYIPDHSYKGVETVIKNPPEGNKYHFAECSTIETMKAKGRYETRYSAVHNPDGRFRIVDAFFPDGEMVELRPCQNCLKHINYHNFRYLVGRKKRELIDEFALKDLFSTYSSLFRSIPSDKKVKGGYTTDWNIVSAEYRASKNYCCESCHVDLTNDKVLLHTHHINGNKQDNSVTNLKALCIDCHRKQPDHDHVNISHNQMQAIMNYRREQGLLDINDWDEVFELADESVHGLLYHYQYKRNDIPEIGYEVTSSNGSVIAELELAWPERKRGIAIGSRDIASAKAAGWQVISVDEAVRLMNNK